ncbi:MAG: hypothetical protein ACREPB_09725 [Arenimonas sp.]
MATQYRQSGASPFIGDTLSPDGVRKEFIEAPMEAAKQAAIGTGLELFAFMTALPDAFILSEQRELKRLSRSSKDKSDPRIERLKVSIERGKELHTHTQQGKTRIERLLVSLSEADNVFHGFVSDTQLQAREKLTVRISAAREGEKSEKSLSATTDADGYFSISLGKESRDGSKKPMPESTVNLSDRMNELLMRVNARADTATESKSSNEKPGASNDKEVLAHVEILDANKNVIYQDTAPLVVNAGTAYREYIVDDTTRAGKDRKSEDVTGPRTDVKKTSASNEALKKTVVAKKTTPEKGKK